MSAWNNTEFLPEGSFDELINRKEVQVELPNIPSELVDFICKEAKRVFATMLFCGLDEQELISTIESFQNHVVTDALLPIPFESAESCQKEKDSWCSNNSALHAFHCLPWRSSSVITFCEAQWKFLAPVFTFEKFSEAALQPSYILPFISTKQAFQGPDSDLFDVEIHEDHQEIVLPVLNQAPSMIESLLITVRSMANIPTLLLG